MVKNKKSSYVDDYIKASRKGSREAEIEMYGHPINHTRVWKSKMDYTRKSKYKPNYYEED